MDVDLSRCLQGDKAAWDAFVTATAPVIYAAVQRTLDQHAPHRRQEAEDLAQDVYLRLLKDDYHLLRRFDPARAALSTFLTLIARSVTLDRLRRQHLPITALDDAALNVPAPDQPPGAAAADPPLAALPPDLLSERQRLVMTLLFEREMDVPEVARFLHVDEQTVRSTKHKALLKLRAHFGAKESE